MATTENSTGWLSCHVVLYIMVIMGFMLNYALRVNLTIAIVAMVEPTSNITLDNYTISDQNVTMETPINGDRFVWDAFQQNLLHGCFYWGYILTEIPGGRMAEVFGAKRVFGYSMLAASLLTLLTPAAAYISYVAVIVLRVLLGFFLGATWPAILPLAARWIPPMERSKFMSNMMASSLGAAITMPICGFLISTIGWESVFYFTGVIGLLWSILWLLVIFDSPAQHPRISLEERNHIEKAIGNTINNKSHSDVPWRAMLTSGPVWAIIITHGMSVFGYFTVITQLPTYMKTILHFDIKSNGILSSLPYLGKYFFALSMALFADYLRKSERLSTTATRKIFTTFAVGMPSILMVVQVFCGYNRVWSVAIFTLALTLNGAVTGGYLGNGLDIAPNYSGTIFGMANTLSSLGGFLSSYMVGTLTFENQTYGQWQIIFWILAGTYFCGAVTFLLFGSGNLQPWNSGNNAVHANGKSATNGMSKGDNYEEQIPLREKIPA
ncbi:sialin [Arctopsyche grandis]|uniref:sialin n=1 Tax=Arctopsyche grandis TaxID=121162 RepID=UPI00406D8D8D